MQPYTLRTLSPQEVESLYETRMKPDFPPAERPPLDALLPQVEAGRLQAYAMTDGSQDYAYVLAAPQGKYVLFTHLAVFAEYRGGGYGSRLLDLLNTSFASQDVHIVEVENPAAAPDAAARQLMERRIAFYERAGYQILRGVAHYILFGVDMLLMTRGRDGLGQPPAGEVAEVLRAMYYSQLSPERRHHFDLRLTE